MYAVEITMVGHAQDVFCGSLFKQYGLGSALYCFTVFVAIEAQGSNSFQSFGQASIRARLLFNNATPLNSLVLAASTIEVHTSIAIASLFEKGSCLLDIAAAVEIGHMSHGQVRPRATFNIIL